MLSGQKPYNPAVMRNFNFFRMKLFILLFCTFLVACSASQKYLGTDQPLLAGKACPLKDIECTRSVGDVNINYSLKVTSEGNYTLNGAAAWYTKQSVIENVLWLNLHFFFFDGTKVAHVEIIQIRGKVNKFIEFTHDFATDTNFGSSIFAGATGRARE
jgi:hypothetical protein